MTTKIKWCAGCKKHKPLEEFYRDKTQGSKYKSRCIPCWRDHYRSRQVSSRYGLSSQAYAELVQIQDNKCAICKLPETYRHISVDHWHATGDVRGLLCSNCNTGIGSFKDNPNLLEAAAVYLRERGYGN